MDRLGIEKGMSINDMSEVLNVTDGRSQKRYQIKRHDSPLPLLTLTLNVHLKILQYLISDLVISCHTRNITRF